MFFAKRHTDVLAAALLWLTTYCIERFPKLLETKFPPSPTI